jgi:outer membrane protein assembly factor BamE (lipoprotein component of BamABCDE complex)
MRPWEKRCLYGLPILAVGILGVCYWVMESPAVPRQKFLRLRAGMTTAEIEKVLGKPMNVYSNQWMYGSPWKWNYLKIEFDADSRVKSIGLDDR